MGYITVILLICFTFTTGISASSDNCGYESCHPVKDGFINVHLVPHTHDDVGWLKTVDQYFYGSNTDKQNAGVQYILDTVVSSLRKSRDRRFIYVETAFFWKWWIKQHDIVKAQVRRLVKNGQLEFISGGWSMNDEATTNYQSIIDQMTWGLRKLNDTFGECGRPKVGWQIDPFGHSRQMANIFAELGFDGLLLGRIDYQEKQLRFQTRTPEMVWRGSDSLGEQSDIFTGVMYNVYGPPPGFCFDLLCGDEPFIDDKKSFEYNVDKRVDEFIAYLDNVTIAYSTKNLIITMGEDFNYQDAESWFVNLDKLIQYVNERQNGSSKYNLIYSTPSCYIKAINDETAQANVWRLKQDDFFPYASDPHAFWTGYFTSRPAIKRYERVGNNFLQVCKQLYALADLDPIDKVDLNVLREAMGVMQHHDAITGTEKQHVANDYARHLQRGIEECEIVTKAAINKLSKEQLDLNSCHLLNISQCSWTETTNTSFMITIYNPLSKPVDKVIRLPVTETELTVIDAKGKDVPTQIIPIPDFVRNIPGRVSKATSELVFVASQIPALGWTSYTVQPTSNKISSDTKMKGFTGNAAGFNINTDTGLLTAIQVGNISIPITQNFYYYNGFVGDNIAFENRSSGAYIFRPNGPLTRVAEKVRYEVHQGEIVAELHQWFNDYIGQIIRVNAFDNSIEFDWVVGPLPHDGLNGLEVISKYTTGLRSNATFYTDSNGRGTLKRLRDFRPAWNLNLSEPVSGNYYPITSEISIRDDEKDLDFVVLVDRAEGGSSLQDGEIELMVHRNCLHDDAFGVGEALNETAFGKGLVVRGSHYVTVGSRNTKNKNEPSVWAIAKDIAQKKLLDAWIFFSPVTKGQSAPQFSGLRHALPENVQILTLEPWIGFSHLLRLQHIYEKNEDPVLAQPAVIQLADLFASFEITSIEETTLGANQWLKDSHRLHFGINGTIDGLNADSEFVIDKVDQVKKLRTIEDIRKKYDKRHTIIEAASNPLEVTLLPGQIRTFVIDVKTNY